MRYSNTKNDISNLIAFVLIVFLVAISSSEIIAQSANIKNDSFWNTKNGEPLFSQGGGVFKFADPITGEQKYYWYGVQYKEADMYRNNPSVTLPNATFESVTCYSSTDLVNWTFENDVVTKDKVNQSGRTWVGRLGVAYIKEIQKYALFVQHGSGVLIALSDSPTDEFVWNQKIDMTARIGTSNTGDQTVFTDEDTGKSYLIYSYGKGRNKIYISEIGVKEGKVDLLDCTEIFKGASREGNCMFKYNNKYYMYASNIYGWDGSLAYYLVADAIRGPYLPQNDMLITAGSEADFAHISQTGFFVSVKGTEQETIIFCGDRWSDFAGNGLGYNQWCPLSFEGNTPYFNSLNSWNLDAQTGKWKVADDNNYIKNPSFEADRRHIPSPVKPVQIVLTGWDTEVLKGNKISLDSVNSPVINYFNSAEDRKIVVGEKSLNISDKVAFKRKISQIITSSKYVALENGLYTLTAKVKNSKGFSVLEMYATSEGKTIKSEIKKENDSWTTLTINKIPVKAGKIEIGFLAEGDGNAFCLVDDVSFVKSK